MERLDDSETVVKSSGRMSGKREDESETFPISPLVTSPILSFSRLVLLSQGLKNSPEVADASAGNRLGIRTKVEDLHRNITLITIFH